MTRQPDGQGDPHRIQTYFHRRCSSDSSSLSLHHKLSQMPQQTGLGSFLIVAKSGVQVALRRLVKLDQKIDIAPR